MKNIRAFAAFISAREAVRVNREAGKPWPWTKDPVLQTYRFCNINREHDTVTRGIRELYQDMPEHDLWFHLIVARLFNHVPTLSALGPLKCASWPTRILTTCSAMEADGKRVFNPAYIVSTNGHKMPKVPYLIERVLWDIAKWWAGDMHLFSTCQGWADFLLGFNGLGDFMVNQIVTDMKYTTLLPKELTADWRTFVMAGPGTKRGLNRIWGNPTKAPVSRHVATLGLLGVRRALDLHPLRPYFDDLNNLANSFCEFDKYCRVASGEGKPKQLYRGRTP